MKFYLSIFCLLNLITVVKSALLDISPSTNIQAGAPTLTVRCQPTTASGVTDVYRLDIYRLTVDVSTEQNLGNIQVGKEPELGLGLTNPKFTASGSLTAIDAVSTSFVQIVIQDPNCCDKGEYICKVTGGNTDGPLTRDKRTNIIFLENPSNLVMNVVPSRLEFKLNDSIAMTCNGNVGNPPKTWQWETRRYAASTQWFRYTEESDIVTEPVSPPPGSSCSYRQKTVLNYTVKAHDDGLQIRCILDDIEEFSKNFTINIVQVTVTSTSSTMEVTVTSTTSTSPTFKSSKRCSSGSNNHEDKTSVIVLGILVAISVVFGIVVSIIAVYFYRKLKNDSRTENENSIYESIELFRQIPTTN